MNRVWHSGPFKGCPHPRPVSGLQFPAGRGPCLGLLQPGEGLAWSAVLGPPTPGLCHLLEVLSDLFPINILPLTFCEEVLPQTPCPLFLAPGSDIWA